MVDIIINLASILDHKDLRNFSEISTTINEILAEKKKLITIEAYQIGNYFYISDKRILLQPFLLMYNNYLNLHHIIYTKPIKKFIFKGHYDYLCRLTGHIYVDIYSLEYDTLPIETLNINNELTNFFTKFTEYYKDISICYPENTFNNLVDSSLQDLYSYSLYASQKHKPIFYSNVNFQNLNKLPWNKHIGNISFYMYKDKFISPYHISIHDNSDMIVNIDLNISHEK